MGRCLPAVRAGTGGWYRCRPSGGARLVPSGCVVKSFMSEVLIRVGYAAAVTGLVGVVAVVITTFGA